MKSMMKAVQILLTTLLATLREIFDEAPYARFLCRTHALSSPESYAAFCRERESTSARRPRCC